MVTRKRCTGQVLPSAKYWPKVTSPMNAPTCRRCIATYWKDQTRRSHRQIASLLIFTTKLQISPLIVSGFKNGFHQWIQHIFLVVMEAKKFFQKFFLRFQNLDALYRPVAGKPFVLEDLCFGMGTSVASALTVEAVEGFATPWQAQHDKRKSRRCRALKPLELRSSRNSRRRVLWHTTLPVNLV